MICNEGSAASRDEALFGGYHYGVTARVDRLPELIALARAPETLESEVT